MVLWLHFAVIKLVWERKPPLGDGAELRNAHVIVIQRDFVFKKILFIEVKLIYSVVPVSSVFQRGFTDVTTYSEESIWGQKVTGMGYQVKKKKTEGEGNVYT